MPLQVMDRQGEPLGLLVGRYGSWDDGYYYVVACNKESCPWEELLPTDKLEGIAATHLGTKNMLGRVQQDKLYEKLEEWWSQEQGLAPAEYEPHLALRALTFVQYAYSPFKLLEKVEADYYFLCKSKKLVQGKIQLDITGDDLHYPEEELPFPALVGEVVRYPEIEMDVAGVGETLLLGGSWNDLGGRNHTHATGLWVRSGDVETRLNLSGIIPTRRGELLAVEVKREGDMLNLAGGRIFTGGILYSYR